MSVAASERGRSLAAVDRVELTRALRGAGLWLDVGIASIRLHSDCPALAPQLQVVYGEFAFNDHAEWADLHVRIDVVAGLRRWFRPQINLRCDSQLPFDPFPADSPLPLFEWGCNWLIGHRMNDVLLLHAGAVEKAGLALLLPALPGSGKSTLTAALSQRGWRLLSDGNGSNGNWLSQRKLTCGLNQRRSPATTSIRTCRSAHSAWSLNANSPYTTWS